MRVQIEPVTIDGRHGFVLPSPQGEPVFYTPVLPDDADRLRRGVEQMSPISRYFRFLEHVSALSERQIENFTHPDQRDHVAWGALEADRAGLPGIGLARMFREPDPADAAEFAIAVIDPWQSRRVGTVLLAILFARAARLGIGRLRGWVLPDNRRMVRWCGRLGCERRCGQSPCELWFTLPYRPPAGEEANPTAEAFSELIERLAPVVNAGQPGPA